MNEQLKKKRDEWCANATTSPRDKYDIASLSWDACYQAVTEMLGEFPEKSAELESDCEYHALHVESKRGFVTGAEWMHAEMMRKLGVK